MGGWEAVWRPLGPGGRLVARAVSERPHSASLAAMARVVLVQPPHRDTFGYSMPPLGALHIGAAARAAGHEVVFLDFALALRRGEFGSESDGDATVDVVRACVERILEREPDAVGIGAMISSMPVAAALVAKLHERAPELPVILGGQGPETIEEVIVERWPGVDVIAVGEADVTFVEWLAVLGDRAAWTRVPGLVVRDPAGAVVRTPPRAVIAQLDDVHSPAWDLAESPDAYARAADSLDEGALFPIDLGRGCTFACTFCTTPIFWGRRARHLSATRAVDELDRLETLGGVGCAYVTHDLFTFDRQSVLAICAEKIARGNTLPWECRTRIDLVDEELLVALRDAGCRRILYGVESADATGLARVNKGGSAGDVDVLDTLRMASRVGVASILGLMIGVPGERLAEVEANLRLMRRAAIIDGVSLSLHWFNALPGNGQADTLGPRLRLEPDLHADLVRGHQLFPHAPSPSLVSLIADDDTIFSAFRVAPTDHLATRTLFLLTRNAHLLLEVFPRTIDLLGRQQRSATPLLDALLAFLERLDEHASRSDLSEPLVLLRDSAVQLFLDDVLVRGDASATAMALYEAALFGTEEPQLLRFDADVRSLIAALDTDAELPDSVDDDQHAFLFTRHGDVVRARAVSPFLADAFESRGDTAQLTDLWPDADDATITRAVELLDHTLANADDARVSWRCPPTTRP